VSIPQCFVPITAVIPQLTRFYGDINYYVRLSAFSK